jgi:iron(III) transport system ATP-binding protein
VAVRPEAWHINRLGCGDADIAGVKGRLLKSAYPGSFFEYTFETELGPIFVVSPDLANVQVLGSQVGLTLADHGVSVVKVL